MTNAPTVRRRFIISGRVQGVGFRAWAVRRAQALEVRGTVRNRPDGAVEIEAEGAAEAIGRLREVLARGPDSAIVRRVQEEPPSGSALPPGFRVVY
jgi:acylphosphatase